MGIRNKERKLYLDALMSARNIIAISGVQGLEREIIRQQKDMGNAQVTSRFYSQHEKTAMCRAGMEEELKVLAASIAATLNYEMNMPMSMILEFLEKWNEKISLYRSDPDELRKAEERLSKDHMVTVYCSEYLKGARKSLKLEEKEDGRE